MAEAPYSALTAAYVPGAFGVGTQPPAVTLAERAACRLIQLSGWPDSFSALCEQLTARLALRVPADCLTASTQERMTVFRVGPTRLWFSCEGEDDRELRALLGTFDAAQAMVTEIGHSRSVIRISGAGAPTALGRGLPIDLDGSAFPENAVAQSVIHHIPALVHRLPAGADPTFDLYVPREYAVSFWEWLVGAAAPLGGLVEARSA